MTGEFWEGLRCGTDVGARSVSRRDRKSKKTDTTRVTCPIKRLVTLVTPVSWRLSVVHTTSGLRIRLSGTKTRGQTGVEGTLEPVQKWEQTGQRRRQVTDTHFCPRFRPP